MRSYITVKVLSTINRVKLINTHKFTKVTLNKHFDTFLIYIAAVKALMVIHPNWVAPIGALQQDKALTKIPAKYADIANDFSFDLTMELFENTRINKYAIELVKDKQPLYGSIYSFRLVELKTLKTYTKTHIKTGFIQSSKSPASAFILLDKKPDSNLRLWIDYWDLNNLTIKNWYLFSLIAKGMDQIGWA